MCERLVAVIDLLGMSDAALSQHLSYANATTLSGVRRGTVFPDAERLARLGQMVLGDCANPNLHWILTGGGKAFMLAPRAKGADAAHVDALNRLAIAALEWRKDRGR